MKRTVIIAMAALLMLGISSCNKQKDGVFNPKQKISAIYVESHDQDYSYNSETYTWEVTSTSNTPYQKEQEWTWDGKKLQQIKYFDGEGGIGATFTYTYDGKKLTRIDAMNSDGEKYYSTFEYDGKELITANIYDSDGSIYSTYKYTHTDKKITDIVWTEYNYDKCASSKVGRKIAALRMILPKDQVNERLIADYAAKLKTKATTDITRITYTWTDNNITSVTYKWSDGETSTVSYTYDTKKNPYYGYMGMDIDESGSVAPNCASENNIIMEGSRSYVYEYDKNDYPTNCTYTSTYNGDTYRWKFTRTTTYEYLK